MLASCDAGVSQAGGGAGGGKQGKRGSRERWGHVWTFYRTIVVRLIWRCHVTRVAVGYDVGVILFPALVI